MNNKSSKSRSRTDKRASADRVRGKKSKDFDNDKLKGKRGGRRFDDRDNDIRDGRNARSDRDPLAGVNDMSWYDQYPLLTQTAAAFPFPYRPGMVLDLGTGTVAKTASTNITINLQHQIPGVCALNWYPSVGQSQYPTDPASIAGKEMYARVRKVYSGGIDADAPDFVMYVLALDSAFAYCAWLKRLYRSLNAWTPDNYALPDALCMAYGLEAAEIADLRANRAQFLHQINELILQTQKFRCPAIMDIFNRHYWMSDNVYSDANTINSQLYVFQPLGLYKLNPNMPTPGSSSITAAGLQVVSFPTTSAGGTVTVSSLIQYGLDMLQALDAWDDSYLISGYLMRAYEDTPSFIVEPLQVDEKLVVRYVEEVLMQIENSRTALGAIKIGNLSVFQNPATNAIVSQPICTTPKMGGAPGIIAYLPATLSIRSDSPSISDNVIASRLQTLTSADVITPIVTDPRTTDTNTSGQKLIAGTEILATMIVYNLDRDSVLDQKRLFSVVGASSDYLTDDNTTWLQLPYYFELSEFDWHPITWIAYHEGGATKNVRFMCNGDTHNITTVSQENFELLNRTCLFSEFRSFTQQ